MPHVAQRPVAEPMADEPDVGTDAARRGGSPEGTGTIAANKVVPLFAAPEDRGGTPEPGEAAAVDWPSAIEQLRGVGARLRRMHDLAQAMIRRSLDQAEQAERRADAAAAEAAASRAQADGAEERLRHAEARARRAEDRADAAEAAEAEARLWLRRTYAWLKKGDAPAGPETS